jgi:hypothetical protein
VAGGKWQVASGKWEGRTPLPSGEVGECNEPGEGFLAVR